MRILVTGANGITGHAVIRHLVARRAEVLGLVSQQSSAGTIAALGATPIVGDLRDNEALRHAMAPVDRVYHICPAWVPDEIKIGETVIAAAQASDIVLFGYHSTVAPHIEEVPSRWDKMRLQMALMHSGLAFSVIQPASYMRNLDADLARAASEGSLAQPYRVDAPLSWVDIEDVGEAISRLMTRPEQAGGTYELCGTDTPLTPEDIAKIMSKNQQRQIEARVMPVDEYIQRPPFDGYNAAQLKRLRAYFRFLDTFGMPAGNPNVLRMLLGRAPTTFGDYAERTLHPIQ